MRSPSAGGRGLSPLGVSAVSDAGASRTGLRCPAERGPRRDAGTATLAHLRRLRTRLGTRFGHTSRISRIWSFRFNDLEAFSVGWRRERDSNPRYGFPYTRFPSVHLQPLGHLSVRLAALAPFDVAQGVPSPCRGAHGRPREARGQLYHRRPHAGLKTRATPQSSPSASRRP